MVVKTLKNDWQEALRSEFEKPYFELIASQVNHAYESATVYPPAKLLFNAFNLSPFENTRVVIIGQDPYHGPGQANGLCFSVNDGVKSPPSLVNIFKELKLDIPGIALSGTGNLEPWAKQGVLLLNACLSVVAGQPGSHKSIGWERFTDAVISMISERKEHVVFMLWGNYALGKAPLIDESRHKVLRAAHPSPLARGAFFGSRHFSQANEYLMARGLQPIDWAV